MSYRRRSSGTGSAIFVGALVGLALLAFVVLLAAISAAILMLILGYFHTLYPAVPDWGFGTTWLALIGVACVGQAWNPSVVTNRANSD